MVSDRDSQCSFYRIPKITERGEFKEFSKQKLSSWISALGICNDDPTSHENIYVCQGHYIIGTIFRKCVESNT